MGRMGPRGRMCTMVGGRTVIWGFVGGDVGGIALNSPENDFGNEGEHELDRQDACPTTLNVAFNTAHSMQPYGGVSSLEAGGRRNGAHTEAALIFK